MQNGCLMRNRRLRGPEVWEYRWREAGPDGKRKHRRIVIGTVDQFNNVSSALAAIAALKQEINSTDIRMRSRLTMFSELVDHYRQRELTVDNLWKSHATKMTYEGYLRKWIVPRWGKYILSDIKTMEVELWLRQVSLARATCSKLRNVMSVVFNHAIRHDLFDRNPITFVRQSAKRRKVPEILTVAEVQQLLAALGPRERTMVLLDVGTGLRLGELFGLKWKDVHFSANEISVTRSIVQQVVGHCKTETSQKPIPLDPDLATTLLAWRQQTPYTGPEDWVFASPWVKGRKPFWGQCIMRSIIHRTAREIGITKRFGWHTFRHTYCTLLRATGADIKVMQELLRHSTSRLTMDTYTQAVTQKKREAQSVVVGLLLTKTGTQTG